MFWKKWFKKGDASDLDAVRPKKLPKPKEMVQEVGMYMVTKLKMDPDWVWSLHCVTRPREDGRWKLDIRIFSRKSALEARVNIVNYNSLDDHPELIIYEGHYEKGDYQKTAIADKRITKAA